MSFMSFLIGAAGAAGAMHILSLSLDDYTASLNFANYKNAGAARESFKPPFSIQVGLMSPSRPSQGGQSDDESDDRL